LVKIINPLGDIKVGRQGEAVFQRRYGEQIRRQVSPKRAIPSQAQIDHRQLYRAALAWRKQLPLANRRYLDGYCITNWVVDAYNIPLAWSRFALKLYLQAVKFVPDLEITQTDPIDAEKKDYTDESAWALIDGGQAVWLAQTFTPLEYYTTNKLVLLMSKRAYPHDITVGIRLTDGEGKPTGNDLTSGTTDGDTLPTGTPGEWREVQLTPYALTQGVKYAIVARAPGATATNTMRWWRRNDNSNYPRGSLYTSINSGVAWTGQSYDFNFEVWSAAQEGEYSKEGILHVRHPALLTVVQKRGGLTIRGYDTLSSLDEQYLTKQVGLDVESGDLIKATTLPGIEYCYLVS